MRVYPKKMKKAEQVALSGHCVTVLGGRVFRPGVVRRT